MAKKIHRNSLKPGYKIGSYEIIEVLGQGGFGITYLANDIYLNRRVAIKEYLPIELAVREGDFSVHPLTEDRGSQFRWGLDRFLKEARTLAQFEHPNIVRVHAVFEENNTGYMVMAYEEGNSLQTLLSSRRTMEEAELMKILVPVLGGLEQVHRAGFIHRDIKPDNIFIREDGSPVLLDFGSARQALGVQTKTLTSLVTPGYAPFEQYYTRGEDQGPWTDIYGMGATLYRAIAGIAPMDAIDRSKAIVEGSRDIFVPAAEIGKGKYSERFLNAIDHALQFKPADRPQDIGSWKAEFGIKDDLDEIERFRKMRTAVTRPGTRRVPERKARLKPVITMLLLVTVVCAAGFYYRKDITMLIYTFRAEEEPVERIDIKAPDEQIEITDEKAAEELASLTREEETSRLIEEAENHLAHNRLISPPGQNALESYLKVIEIDPENYKALAGQESIFRHFLQDAENAIRAEKFSQAERALMRAEAIKPDSLEVRLARVRLSDAAREAEQKMLEKERIQKEEEAKRLEEERKQKAEEEARRLAEEQKRKEEEARRLAEEQAKKEEEARRKAEEERQRIEQEALAKAEEEARKMEEEQRKQFARYMEEGDSAMNEKQYATAEQAYSRALEIFPDDSTALSGHSLASEYQQICAALVGSWDWLLGTSVNISADGKLEAIALIPNHGTWECTDPSQRKFTLKWVVGGWVDTLTLSEDGNRVDAINNIGLQFQGWRKGTKREKPAEKNPLLGN